MSHLNSDNDRNSRSTSLSEVDGSSVAVPAYTQPGSTLQPTLRLKVPGPRTVGMNENPLTLATVAHRNGDTPARLLR